MSRKVIKRDGRVVDFDKTRIERAITKAMKSVNKYDKEALERTLANVLNVVETIYQTGKTPTVEQIQDIVELSLMKEGLFDVAKSYILYRKERESIREEKKGILKKDALDEVDKNFSTNSLRLMASRYLLKNEKGELIETPKQMFQRVSALVVIPDILFSEKVFNPRGGESIKPESSSWSPKEWGGKVGLKRKDGTYAFLWNEHHLERMKALYDEINQHGKAKISWDDFFSSLLKGEFDSFVTNFDEYYNLMVRKKFLPNSPTLFNAGTRLGQLSACFVLDIDDDMESIMRTATEAAIIFKSGGGVGVNYSKLRPAGDIVSSTSGVASGPVSFMRIIDVITDVVKQGGRRRGANMGILNVNHPDIEKFITCKLERGKLENFNISVLLTDDFWEALNKNGKIKLINPRDGKVWNEVEASKLLDLIATTAWRTGDPGVVMFDNINKHNILKSALGPIYSTNPCISGDTRILTPNGWIRADELFQEATFFGPVRAVAIDEGLLGEEGEAQAYGTKLITLESNEVVYKTTHGGELKLPVPREVEAWVWHVGRKPGLIVKTKEGYDLTVTHEHKLLTPKGWKEAKSIVPGDKILISRIHPWFLKSAYRGSYDLDEEISFALGWLTGDGSFNENYVAWFFSESDKAAEELLRKGIEKLGGNPTSHTYVLSESEHKIQYNKGTTVYRNLTRLLDSFMEKSKERRLPEIVWRLSSRALAFFLRGLFTADGYVDSDSAVRLTSSSLQLLKEVQILLTTFGIVSKIYERPYEHEFLYVTKDEEEKTYKASGYYELIINGYSRRIFKELIGFESISKLEKLSLENTKKDSIWATVSHVEEAGLVDFYDFTVPIFHNYIGNGLSNHNCGEEPLYPNESCNLGSINLSAFVEESEDGKTFFNWEEYKKTIRIALRFLDNVLDVNKFPLKEIEERTKETRKVGLGLMGLADMLFSLEVPYNSEEGFELMEALGEHLTYFAMWESTELAKERGKFPLYDVSGYVKGEMPIEGYYSSKKRLDWEALRERIKLYGMRNAEVTTIAPTGSISMLADTSSGIEPLYALVYEKRVSVGTFYYVDEVFKNKLKSIGMYNERLLKEINDQGGSIQDIEEIPIEIRKVFQTALDIPWWDHVRAQACFSKWITAATSKTINMPSWVKPEDVKNAYIFAHALGVKGVTIYRDGSLPSQVLVAPSSRKGSYSNLVSNKTLDILRSLGIEVSTASFQFVGLSLKKQSDPVRELVDFQQSKEQKNNNSEKCPVCGSSRLVVEGGCKTCLDCGWSYCPVA
ncbi:MAG: adenosylcobalamin-dependent ribonucleoside-diphosphate reductase [Thermoproteota archaeon]